MRKLTKVYIKKNKATLQFGKSEKLKISHENLNHYIT